MKRLFVLVDGINPYVYSTRICVEGFKFVSEEQYQTLSEALIGAHMRYGLPVIVGQVSDGDVAELYHKLAGEKTQPTEFRDMHGTLIKAGDVLIRRFWARWRERPGHRRVAIDGMSGREVVVPDEGMLKDKQEHWVTYKVMWSGACMIAERHECSDFQALMQAELFDEEGKRITEGSGLYYLNSAFRSEVYEIHSAATNNNSCARPRD